MVDRIKGPLLYHSWYNICDSFSSNIAHKCTAKIWQATGQHLGNILFRCYGFAQLNESFVAVNILFFLCHPRTRIRSRRGGSDKIIWNTGYCCVVRGSRRHRSREARFRATESNSSSLTGILLGGVHTQRRSDRGISLIFRIESFGLLLFCHFSKLGRDELIRSLQVFYEQGRKLFVLGTYEGVCHTIQRSSTAGSSNSVDMRVYVLCYVKVDNCFNSLDVQSSS